MSISQFDITIIGAGLTGLTLAYYLKKEGKRVIVLDEMDRCGGVINTVEENGFIFETGPNTGVIGTPELVKLMNDLTGKIQFIVPDKSTNNRWIWKKGRWHALPTSFPKAIGTPLFTFKDKLGILLEPFRKTGTNPDESVAQMVKRRLGNSYFYYAVDPFISGVYAGDAESLITRYALPKLYNLEHNYGSFIRGAIKKHKEPKSDLEKKVTREVFSVAGGLHNLILALEAEIGPENILTGIKNTVINNTDNGFSTSYTDSKGNNQQIISKYAVTTTSGHRIPELLPFINSNLLKDISNVRYAKVIQAVVCFKHWEGIQLNAFGGLVPFLERRNILGILFPSSLFPGRAPLDGAILSVFLGGIKNTAIFEKDDHEIETIVLKEIQETLKTKQKPDLLKIYRYPYAIPQYEISSGIRFAAIETVQHQYLGLIIAGNSRDGIGMADRIKQAQQVAYQIISGL